MSEAVEETKPHDYPAILDPPKGINIRKAMAGIHLLNGEGSQFRCLVKAGFSRVTARKITANGLTAERCIQEAAKLDSMANPAKMLEAGRSRAMLAIQSCDPSTVQLKDAMRMLEIVEKFYGGHEIAPTNALLGLTDRLAQIASLMAVAQRRQLPVPSIDAEVIEAKVVESVGSDNFAALIRNEKQRNTATIEADNVFESAK